MSCSDREYEAMQARVSARAWELCRQRSLEIAAGIYAEAAGLTVTKARSVGCSWQTLPSPGVAAAVRDVNRSLRRT